jgi:hypothetical protein
MMFITGIPKIFGQDCKFKLHGNAIFFYYCKFPDVQVQDGGQFAPWWPETGEHAVQSTAGTTHTPTQPDPRGE